MFTANYWKNVRITVPNSRMPFSVLPMMLPGIKSARKAQKGDTH